MSPSTTTSRKKKRRLAPRERRFVGTNQDAPLPAALLGMAGAAIFGAGSYVQYMVFYGHREGGAVGPVLVVAGGLLLAVALWLFGEGARPVRVGDLGVAVERGDDVLRLLWCDVERIHAEAGNLILRGAGRRLEMPLGGHRVAAAHALAEAARRVPDALDVARSLGDKLPKPHDDDGETVDAGYDVVGRACAVSDEAIKVEKDARLCPRCGQVYHRSHVPETCVTCEAPVGKKAFRV